MFRRKKTLAFNEGSSLRLMFAIITLDIFIEMYNKYSSRRTLFPYVYYIVSRWL